MKTDSKTGVGMDKNLEKNDADKSLQFVHCGDSQGDKIDESIKKFEESCGLNVKRKKDRDQPESFFSVGDNIKIKAEISGKISEFALNAFKYDQGEKADGSELQLKQGELPRFLTLYISPFCPHCPAVLKDVSRLVLENDNIHLEVIDGLFYEGLAEKNNIKSVPTLVYNENFRWTGQVDLATVVEALDNDSPENLSRKALLTMIEAGRANVLATMMTERNTVFKSLFDLLLDESWSVRLGAMVVAEEIESIDPALAASLMDVLWLSFDKSSETVKGDMLYLAGNTGDKRFIEIIEGVLGQIDGDEIKDVAEEAIQNLKERFDSV